MGGEKKLKKPKLTGLFAAQAKFNLISAIILAGTVGAIFRYGYAIPRRRRYAEYKKNVDVEEQFNKMAAIPGLLQITRK